MPNIKSIVISFIGFLLLCSCSEKSISSAVEQTSTDADYVIPIDEALASLDDFLSEEGKITKGEVHDYIDNYFSVSGTCTKAGGNTDVLYAVNFKDEGGYALLSADRRIPEDIIAVTDNGSVSESDFTASSPAQTPSEGDDLSEEEYNEMVQAGVLAATCPKAIINSSCLKYARDAALDGSTDPIIIPPVETLHWEMEKEVPMMLTTVWTQDYTFQNQNGEEEELFNKYCPMVGLLWWKVKAPAGCVAIAISQIVAYHERPGLSIDGIKIHYPSIKQICSIYYPKGKGNPESREMLNRFVRSIGEKCNTLYFKWDGTGQGFAFPQNARTCLIGLGYKNVELADGYDEEAIIRALNNGCPAFVSACDKLTEGHAWVIDGYKKRKKVSTIGRVYSHQILVHCNWGWHGKCNGYFASGVFQTTKPVEGDGFVNTKDFDFWRNFSTITYDNPVK